jgi:hypothetical protein
MLLLLLIALLPCVQAALLNEKATDILVWALWKIGAPKAGLASQVINGQCIYHYLSYSQIVLQSMKGSVQSVKENHGILSMLMVKHVRL